MQSDAPLRHLPASVDQLLDDLDARIPHAVVDSPIHDSRAIANLNFQAGRRDMVDELLAIRARSVDHG